MKTDGILKLRKFSSYPELVHGFSTQECGDLKIKSLPCKNQNLISFLSKLGIGEEELVVGEQVHGKKVVVPKDGGCVISGADALLTDKSGLYLGVNTADCLPILLYDPENKIVGVCHAGWPGTLAGIIVQTVKKMERMGAQPDKVIVGIGPHIKVCCYNVPEERIKIFEKKFGPDRKMFRKKNGKIYLDLTYLNLNQLKEAGVKGQNIEVVPYCTYCSGKDFFSYRRQGGNFFSEMLGVIGRRE